MRTESDLIGSMKVPDEALYGIHALRAAENFHSHIPFSAEWYAATALVKKAVFLTSRRFFELADKKVSGYSNRFSGFDEQRMNALIVAADEVSRGMHIEHFIVPACCGGAGTSINMNINEIIANRALQITGRQPGDYSYIDPLEHANIFQSTNDVIPTALRLVLVRLCDSLEAALTGLIQSFEGAEAKFRDIPRLSYTQMQAAVPSGWGLFFASATEALIRDRWRLSRCREKLKVINLGGSAIGTGISVPRFVIMEAWKELATLSGLPLSKADHLPDATSNQDVLAEFHAMLKTLAVNMEKTASDIRLLASDLAGNVLSIPKRQAGSSVMPGKVNPVIPEFIICISHKVYGNDVSVGTLCGQGCLELNAYLPVIGHTVIESASLLISACQSMEKNLVSGIVIQREKSTSQLYRHPAITTALLPVTGYHKATELARYMTDNDCDIFTANNNLKILDENILTEMIDIGRLIALGFTVE